MTLNNLPKRGSGRDLIGQPLMDAIAPLLADGWTQDGALNHVQGSCDRAICCGWEEADDDGTTTEELYLVCRQCGEAFHSKAIVEAYGHKPGDCGSDQGWDLLPESEAM